MFARPVYSKAFPPAGLHAEPAPVFLPQVPQVPQALLSGSAYDYGADFYSPQRDVKRQLFVVDPASPNVVLGPRFPANADAQRDVINRYVTFHRIAKEEMLDFWMDYVDCLLSCPNFEEQSAAEFRAWAYGRLCRYLLLHRREARVSGAYDPVCNPVSQSDLASFRPAEHTAPMPTRPQMPTATADRRPGPAPAAPAPAQKRSCGRTDEWSPSVRR